MGGQQPLWCKGKLKQLLIFRADLQLRCFDNRLEVAEVAPRCDNRNPGGLQGTLDFLGPGGAVFEEEDAEIRDVVCERVVLKT